MDNSQPPGVPKSLLQCMDPQTGDIDPIQHFQYRRKLREEASKDDYLQLISICELIATKEAEKDPSTDLKERKKRERYMKKQKVYRDDHGKLQPIGPYQTSWYRNYVLNPDIHSKRFRVKFRRRFRMKFDSFQKHLAEVKASDLFTIWSEKYKDCVGNKASPIELLLLGTLRYLGRGWTLDDLEEQTSISEETHRRFLHVYLLWGSTEFVDRYVYLPANKEEAAECASEYGVAGFRGCIGSADATHIGMLKCCYKLRNHHDSFKLNMPTRTYNMTVNHRRRILATTHGHPGRWSDKTLVRFDTLANKLKRGEIYSDMEFVLLERDADGNLQEVRYSGAWTIVDNGYLKWSVTVPPMKYWSTYPQMRFSKWLESLRKDVECTFGILKGRFRILKTGIPLHGIEVCDRVWLTCCALHNFLLEEDGLDGEWGATRYYVDPNESAHDEEDVRSFLGPNLLSVSKEAYDAIATLDASGMGAGSDRRKNNNEEAEGGDKMDEDTEGDDKNSDGESDDGESTSGVKNPIVDAGGCIQVHSLSLESFRNRLIHHFDILWKANKISWPTRTGSEPPAAINEPNERFNGMLNN